METKQCSKCRLGKPISEFYLTKNKPHCQCKKCENENSYKWRLKNLNTSQKTCQICNQIKPRNEFYKYNGYYYRKYCLECYGKMTPEQHKKDEAFRLRRRNKELSYKRTHIEKTMWKSAKYRAKKNGLPFDIEVSDIVIPKICPVLGIDIKQSEKNNSDNSPSLDKIVPELGYVKGNVMVISWRANSLKRDTSPEELKLILNYIEKFSPKTLDNETKKL